MCAAIRGRAVGRGVAFDPAGQHVINTIQRQGGDADGSLHHFIGAMATHHVYWAAVHELYKMNDDTYAPKGDTEVMIEPDPPRYRRRSEPRVRWVEPRPRAHQIRDAIAWTIVIAVLAVCAGVMLLGGPR